MTVEGIDKNPKASYLWFVISTLPYCSIQSLPTMILCTQHVGFVHVYASLCLKNKNPKPRKINEKRYFVLKGHLSQMPLLRITNQKTGYN